MASVNLFIGGTGIELAVLVKASADFYNFEEKPAIFALDTDTASQQIAERQLGKQLVLSAPGFLERVKQKAAIWQGETWNELWQRDRIRSFGDPLLRAGAEVINSNFEATGGLWTLRSAGWIAFQDINERNPFFVQNICTALTNVKTAAPNVAPALNVIASIAGGTGSGLFIPMIAAIRKQIEFPIEVNLHVVTPSAFKNNWDSHSEGLVLTSRGQAGAYAAYREIMQLSREAEQWSSPEERTIMGLAYHRPGKTELIQKVFWWGRRQIDASSRADDTFYEAGRLVTLLNDANVYAMFGGAQAVGNNRRVAAIATIEYPKLEMSQGIAAAAIAHFARQVRSAVDRTTRTRILARTKQALPGADAENVPELAPPLLSFINSQRSENQALGDKGTGRVVFADVERDLVAPMKVIERGAPAGPLTNRIRDFLGGNDIWQPNYTGTDAEWRAYLDRATAKLQELEARSIQETRAYLKWMTDAATSWIGQAAAAELEESRDPVEGLPSLPKARQSLLDLVDDLDRARILFEKPFDETIARDPQLQPVSVQAARVDALKAELAGMVEANPEFKRQPPRGVLYHPIFQVIPAVALLVFLVAAIVQLVPNIPLIGGLIALVASAFGYIGARIGSLGVVVFRGQPQFQELMAGATVCLFVFLLFRFMRNRAFKEPSQLRQEKETELRAAWEDLTLFKMLELTWQAAAATCERLAGKVPQAEVGSGRRPSDGSVLARPFDLINSGAEWLGELAELADRRKRDASKQRPGWIRTVGSYDDPPAGQLVRVIPDLRLRPSVQGRAGLQVITDLDIGAPRTTTENVEGGANIPFSEWKPLDQRNDPEKRAHDERLGRFYEDLEKQTLPRVAEMQLLQPDLESAIAKANWSPADLAEALDLLARKAQERGLGADLTVPQTNVTPYLFVPQNAEARVTAALSHARQPQNRLRYQGVASLPPQVTATENVGHAIAFVQTATFGDDADVHAPKLRDIEENARNTYYGVGHLAGKPSLTKQYSAKNTEFHLLPEPSSAAVIEVAGGRDQPLVRALTQRLYGTHQALGAHPSLIELFYLARVKGFLVSSESGQPPRTLWSLVVDDKTVPLIDWPSIGAAAVQVNDPLARARPLMALFDAFRICLTAMTVQNVAVPAPSLPANAQVQNAKWPQREVTDAIDSVRGCLVKLWMDLRGNANKAARDEMFAAMARLADEDLALMTPAVGEQWKLVTNVVFARGKSNLTG